MLYARCAPWLHNYDYVVKYAALTVMPTFIDGTALGPAEDRTIDDALVFGREQWQQVWSVFARQFSQPKLIKLAEQTLGSRAIHSSQIFGFTSGKLRDPSPKLLMSLGYLNLAIAAANGEEVESPYKVPGTLSELWQGKTWLKDASGAPLGPEGVFAAITGIIDLGINRDRHIPVQAEAEVCNALGKFLRMELAKNEVDWMGELFELRDSYGITCLEDLLMRSKTPTPGTTLIEELPKMAELVGVSEEEIWAVAIAPHLERL